MAVIIPELIPSRNQVVRRDVADSSVRLRFSAHGAVHSTAGSIGDDIVAC
jgi:hypothetical protein